ncbi:MAG: hypothetical protein RJA76_71 [Bacteroidota bacterium]|jgi:hypothetical protein
MRYWFLCLFLAAGLISCENKQKEALSATETAIPAELQPTLEKKPIMVFDQKSVYLGRIKEGDSLYHTFHFRNRGNLPLKIISVNVSCGCTSTKWSKETINPGKKGFIKIKFNSSGRIGRNSKSITAYCNTMPMDNQVSFKVDVVPNK